MAAYRIVSEALANVVKHARASSATVRLRDTGTALEVEVRDETVYFFSGRVPGMGGLPLGVEGRAVCLLSGGFDSAVAAWLLLKRGVELEAIGVDASHALLRDARTQLHGAIAGDARLLPIADGAADVVTCSQVLHHFFDSDLPRLVSELNRVSRGWVIVSDLQRSWLAAGGFWLVSSALRFHEVTRVDGMTSVLRGFQPLELTQLVQRATGATPFVRKGAFWRLTARWRPPGARTAH